MLMVFHQEIKTFSNIKHMTKDFEKNEKKLIASYRRDKRKKFHMSKRKGRVDLRTNKPGKRK